MTAIVGVLCRDGVVIGTDSSATFTAGGFNTIEQPTEKLDVVADRIIIAGTGQIGLGQRFKSVVQNAWDRKAFQNSAVETGKELSRSAIADFAFTQVPMGQYGALVAFSNGTKPQLCEFALQDFQPELKTDRIWYCSMGSAQLITDPFLAFMREVFWCKGQPSVQDATLAVTWTLDHAVAINPGGVNGPVRVAVLEPGDKGHFFARLLADSELEEHRQLIFEAKDRLRRIREDIMTSPAPDIPRP